MRQLLYILTICLISCSGSDTYRGSWKATDAEDAKYEIVFNAKDFVMKDSMKQSKTFEYTQNSVEVSNSKTTYGITLSDGEKYKIHFPNPNNDSTAYIKDDMGNVIYRLSRKNYITNADYKFE